MKKSKLLPAVRVRGSHYAHEINHASAVELAAHSLGMTYLQLMHAVDYGREELTIGYENEKGEFTTQTE